MKNLFAVLVLFVAGFYSEVYGLTFVGDLSLTSQSQVNAFNYDVVTGILRINGTGITNIDSIYKLDTVGNLYIQNTNITHVNGLQNLKLVSGDGLGAGIYFWSNSLLNNLSGLTNTKFGASMYLQFNGCPALTNFNGLSDLDWTQVNKTVFINNCAALTSLSGLVLPLTLPVDNKITTLTISNNANLTDVSALAGFSVGELILDNNDKIAAIDLSGAPAYRSYVDIDIRNNDKLKNIKFSANTATSLALVNNVVLDTISGMTQVLGNNPGFRFIDIVVQNNPELRYVNLFNFTDAKSGSVNSSLVITNNAKLPHVNFLQKISYMRVIKVQNNALLSYCCGLYNMLKDRVVNDSISIFGNPSACGSAPEILNACDPLSEYNGDITIGNNTELQSFALNYNRVTGVLKIKQSLGPVITSLASLSGLTSVGKLVLEGLSIRNLNGLQNLTGITGYQADSSSGIYPDLSVSYCTLRTLDSIGNYNQLNPQIKLNISVNNNDSLIDVSGLFSPVSVLNTLDLNIADNASLSAINGMKSTFNIKRFFIHANNKLQNFTSATNAQIDWMSVDLNPQLQATTSIRINNIRQLYFDENNSVSTLNLYVDNTPSVPHKRLGISRCKKIKQITGLSTISAIAADSSLSAFLIARMDSLSAVEVIGNDTMSVHGVGNADMFAGGVVVSECPFITNLNFLSNIKAISQGYLVELRIDQNVRLSNCCGIYELLNSRRAPSVLISGNPAECSNQNEITVGCGPLRVSAGRDTTVCAGQPVTLKASGAFSYSWNSGQATDTVTVVPLATGNYVVTGTVHSSSMKDTVTITVKPLPDANFTKIVNGANVQLNAPGGNSTYNWNFGDTQTSSVQNPSHTYAGNGKFYITLNTTLNGCQNQKTDSVTITLTPVKNNISFVERLEIFPNPVRDKCFIQLTAAKPASFRFSLVGIDGKIVYSKTVGSVSGLSETIDCSGLNSGIYMIQLESEGQQSSFQLVKQ